MKIGLILECGPDGADQAVCTIAARKLLGERTEIETATLGNKPALLRDCGAAADRLLNASECERVLIVWDLYPAWRARREKPCRHEDREAIFQSLRNAGVRRASVSLICIQEELEAWLLADDRALQRVINDLVHPHAAGRVPRTAAPDAKPGPKTALNRLFQKLTHRPYVDRIHARLIANQWIDWRRLEASPTFCRFRDKLTG
ncbi:MAG: DUF4276 family protein [Opitutaceae bacterium]